MRHRKAIAMAFAMAMILTLNTVGVSASEAEVTPGAAETQPPETPTESPVPEITETPAPAETETPAVPSVTEEPTVPDDPDPAGGEVQPTDPGDPADGPSLETPTAKDTSWFDDLKDGSRITDPDLLAQIELAFGKDGKMKEISKKVRAEIDAMRVAVIKEGVGVRLYSVKSERCVDAETGEEYDLPDEDGKDSEETNEYETDPRELERNSAEEEALRAIGMRAETNAELVARQQIVIPPRIRDNDFRFWTVGRVYAFAKETVSVKEKMSEEARDIGALPENGLCYILKQEGGWAYVESGRVRGFIPMEKLLCGDEATGSLEKCRIETAVKAAIAGEADSSLSSRAAMATALVTPKDNAAFDYYRATVGQTLADKDPVLTLEIDVPVREDKSEESRAVGTLPYSALAFVLADKDEDWVYIESGNVRGFVPRTSLDMSDDIASLVEEIGEDEFDSADQIVAPKENDALYYTLTSTKEADQGRAVRDAMIEYAAQFIGNPYVWGGLDPVRGADCSGFVLRIYEAFGYHLPRVSEWQSQYGMKIPVSSAEPGDLIFYAREGHVYHVVMYAGDGTTIEAANESVGIIRGHVNMFDAVWATRILSDAGSSASAEGITEENAEKQKIGESLGTFEISYFCSCEECTHDTVDPESGAVRLLEGETIAADPSVLEPGTRVVIGGHVFTVRETGHKVKGNRIAIYVHDHTKAPSTDGKVEVFAYN